MSLSTTETSSHNEYGVLTTNTIEEQRMTVGTIALVQPVATNAGQTMLYALEQPITTEMTTAVTCTAEPEQTVATKAKKTTQKPHKQKVLHYVFTRPTANLVPRL